MTASYIDCLWFLFSQPQMQPALCLRYRLLVNQTNKMSSGSYLFLQLRLCLFRSPDRIQCVFPLKWFICIFILQVTCCCRPSFLRQKASLSQVDRCWHFGSFIARPRPEWYSQCHWPCPVIEAKYHTFSIFLHCFLFYC